MIFVIRDDIAAACESIVTNPQEWVIDSYALTHQKTGTQIWIANGFFCYGFRDGPGTNFLEKIAVANAIRFWRKARLLEDRK
jgi:hypothetical protein